MSIVVNLYAPGIGGLVGFAYETREQAEAAAMPSRIGINEGHLLFISNEMWSLLERYAKAHRIETETAAREAIRAYTGDAA
jgi:hypothetical protein